jgi:hypothetical protein
VRWLGGFIYWGFRGQRGLLEWLGLGVDRTLGAGGDAESDSLGPKAPGSASVRMSRGGTRKSCRCQHQRVTPAPRGKWTGEAGRWVTDLGML